MHEIDRSFRAKRVAAEEKRARAVRQRVLASVLATVAVGLGAGGFFAWKKWGPLPQEIAATDQGPADATPAAEPKKPVVINPIIDLAGDPLIIRLGESGGASSKLRAVAVTPETKQPAIPDEVEVLSDTMLSSSERIMALPSSPEDFAFFQSQSARAARPPPGSQPSEEVALDDAALAPEEDAEPLEPDAEEVLIPVAGQDDVEGVAGDPLEEEAPIIEEGIPTDLAAEPEVGEIGDANADQGAGWGETVTEGQEALPEFKKTEVEDTTTVHLVRPEIERFRAIEDFTVSVKGDRPLEAIIAEYGFSEDDSKNAADAAKRLIGVDKLGDRFIVGLRGARERKGARLRLVQLSINSPTKYFGTIALAEDGAYAAGADPWINDDLSQYANRTETEPQRQSYRLLDAIYSTSTRNSVPSSVTGEAIMLLSRSFDLQALATKDDRLVLAYSKTGRGANGESGRVLFVAIKGVDRNYECVVYQSQPGADFSCMTEKDATHSVTVTNDMVTPVKGVMTSTFGPRMHPILKKVRIHKGVDWGAPIGTPIMAAYSGKISFAGDGKGYGNVVKIDHGGGKATAYAHMSRFAEGMKVGLAVQAGDVIGYVGTTGLSTGPHLHFEVYQNGVAVDPLGGGGMAAPTPSADDTPVAAGSNGSAVELLTNRIIHVESGGNARAKNPLSSATGLGQFIKSTWMRMIRTYRPELLKSMSQEEILALRYDPTISREMVSNLARENEASLRSRGHSITAGRLYLAHFLGPEGAHLALAAPGNALVAEVLGASVISANPFLTGKDCAYVVAWAEKKMTGKAMKYKSSPGGVTSKTVVRTSPEFIAYRKSMLELIELAATSGGLVVPVTETPGAVAPDDSQAPGDAPLPGGDAPAIEGEPDGAAGDDGAD